MLKEESNEIRASLLTAEGESTKVDARPLSHRDLNARLRELVSHGVQRIELHNVYGQRYIGTDLGQQVKIDIFGTPGNDLGAFMHGPRIIVHGNAQDGCGNTMDNGEIVIHGHAGDILGLSARGGKIFIRDDVGYRAGIHMKEYEDRKPTVVIGGTAQDFLGEYMAGGVLIVLGLNLKEGERYKPNFVGTGMHGGVIYIRGDVQKFQLGKEVGIAELDEDDCLVLKELVGEFARHFGCKTEEVLKHKFTKLFPLYLRPYGQLYAY
jgi:glutamate synthase domain-containing protein 3